MDPITADRFRSDLGIACKTVNAGVSAGQAQGANTSLEKWSSFFHELVLYTLLETIVEKYQSYKSLHCEFVLETLQPTKIQSGLDRLKITFSTLPWCSSVWGPRTHT